MKRLITSDLSVLLLAGIPLAALAGTLSAVSGGDSIASALSVLVVGGGLVAWLGRPDSR